MTSELAATFFGGRWSAVYSVWTYFHRLLHIFGITSIDHEELALLSAPLVRIHTFSSPTRVLAHTYSSLSPSEPLGLVSLSSAVRRETLFLLHFSPSGSDHARIATAYPTSTTPRAWIAVDVKSGVLSLAAAEENSAVFELRPGPVGRRSGRNVDVAIALRCGTGTLLSVAPDESSRARVCEWANDTGGKMEKFIVNAVAGRPGGVVVDEEETVDETLNAVLRGTMALPVQLQSAAYGFFFVSSPGCELMAGKKKDSGWNTFTVEFDYATKMARVRDSRGLYLVLDKETMTFKAGITVDGCDISALVESEAGEVEAKTKTVQPEGGASSRFAAFNASTLSEASPGMTGGDEVSRVSFDRAERFIVTVTGDDDCVTLRSCKGYVSALRNGTLCVNQNTKPGRGEEFYLRLALPSMMDQSTPSLRLRHLPRGVREITASIVIPCEASVAYGVLRDYDNFRRFIDDCSASELIGREPREGGRLIVRMAQAHSFLVLTLNLAMTLGVVEDDVRRTVSMDLMYGLGIKTYNGFWHAAERGEGRCCLSVKLSSSPAVPAPNFLVDGVMTHAVTGTLEDLRTECILRSAGPSSPSGVPD